MEHSCFVIMPQDEPNGYASGHFNRVYDYIVVPACRAAGYWPTRSDHATYDNPLAVIKDIIDSEIALCDLSANNATALYGLAIRRGLGLPVTPVKDVKSIITFDAGEFGLVEYDESLRIDTVQKAVEVLGEALKKAVDTKKERHELLHRLSIGLPQFIPQNTPVDIATSSAAEPTHHEEEPKAEEDELPIISPLPDDVGDPLNESQIAKIKTGDVLFHLRHGKGKVNFVKKSGREQLASIQFDSGPKLLVLVASKFFRKINV
jgi:hypothetical protein